MILKLSPVHLHHLPSDSVRFCFLLYEQLFCSNHWQAYRFISFKFIRAAMMGLWVDCSLILIAVNDPQTRFYLMIQYTCMWEACTPCLLPFLWTVFTMRFLWIPAALVQPITKAVYGVIMKLPLTRLNWFCGGSDIKCITSWLAKRTITLG